MAWEIQDAMATLQQAMRLEQDGRKFYLSAAERTQDPAGKKMFASLAADEQEHFDKLKGEYDALASAGKWLSARSVLDRQPARWQAPAIFSAEKEGAEMALSPAANDLDALNFALAAEKESYELYASSRDKADDPDAKALFAFLAAEERSHYELLDAELKYLGDTASYFMIQEGAINEG